MSTQELVTSIVTEQEQSTDQFLALLQQKIDDTIEVRRIELASQMFAEAKGECPECGAGKKECECEDEDEEDDMEEMDEAMKKDEDPVDRPDVPFAGPYRKAGSVKKDQFGNVIKNRAKHLAKMGMAAAMKKEEVEQMDEGGKENREKARKAQYDLGLKGGMPGRKDVTGRTYIGRRMQKDEPTNPKGNFKALSKEEVEQMDEAFVIHKGKHEPGTKSSLEGTHHGVNVKPVYTSKKEAQAHADTINKGRGYKPGDEKSSLYGGVLYQVSPAKSMKEEVEQIDELSKTTLKSYLGKAYKNSETNKNAALKLLQKGGDPNNMVKASKKLNKAVKRRFGVDAAVDKLAGGAKVMAKEDADQTNEMTDRVTVDKITTELGRGKGLPPKVTTNKIVVDKAALGKLGTIKEMAPPGAKYERMVKHIKKGYSKGGLTKKEKSIAYATAWKAKGREGMSEAAVSDAQQMNALGMKGAEKAKTMLALRNYRKHGDINKLSPGHRTLVSGYMEKTGGLGVVSRGVANQALKKERMQEE